MSWPREHEGKVSCIGFSDRYLSTIMMAIDNKMVKWGKSDLFMGHGSALFEWADSTWELTEMNECVISIELLEGTPTDADLTAAVLRC